MAKETALMIVTVHAEDKDSMSHALMQLESDIIGHKSDDIELNYVTYEFNDEEKKP